MNETMLLGMLTIGVVALLIIVFILGYYIRKLQDNIMVISTRLGSLEGRLGRMEDNFQVIYFGYWGHVMSENAHDTASVALAKSKSPFRNLVTASKHV